MKTRQPSREELAALIDEFNRGQDRAREGYAAAQRAPACGTCACGRRTTHPTGKCKRCRDAA